MTQNSALSQNWVECTGCTPKGPWPRAPCARTAPRPRAQHRVVARTRPYRSRARSCRARTLPCRRPLQSRYKNCIMTQTLPRACRSVPTPYRSLAAPYYDTKVAPSHDTNHCITTHPMVRPPTRALPHALARGPAVSWGRVAGLLALSWPPAARPNCLVS